MAEGNSTHLWDLAETNTGDSPTNSCYKDNTESVTENPDTESQELREDCRNVRLQHPIQPQALPNDDRDHLFHNRNYEEPSTDYRSYQCEQCTDLPEEGYWLLARNRQSVNRAASNSVQDLDTAEARDLNHQQLQTYNQGTDSNQSPSKGSASLDIESKLLEAEDLRQALDEMLACNPDIVTPQSDNAHPPNDDHGVLQAASYNPATSINTDETDRNMQNTEEELDFLYRSMAVMEANVAHVKVEQSLYEHELEVVPYGDGEMYVIVPDDLTSRSVPNAQSEQTKSELESHIVEFVDATNYALRLRKDAWTLEINNAEIGEGDSFSPIDMIPDELLLLILSYIPLKDNVAIVSLICKRWYILASDPSLWQHINIPTDSLIDPHWLGLLASKAPKLKSLSARGGRNITNASLSVVSRYCPLLTTVDFGFCNIPTPTLALLVNNCPNIRTVNFEGCECVDTQWVKTLSQFKKLKNVNISHCTHLEDDDIIYMSENLSTLVNVCIDGNSLLSDSCVESLCTRHRGTLVTLALDGAESTDRSVGYAVSCPNLTLLTISFSDTLTNTTVNHLLKSKNLVHLQIRKNKLIDVESLQRLFFSTSLQHLRYLDLSECLSVTDSVVEAICRCCPGLVTLMLQWCWTITDVGVERIVDTFEDMEYLDLLGLDAIEGQTFDKLPEKLPKLTFLNLAQCNRIDDPLIVKMLQRMPQLTAINFYHEDFRMAT